MDAVKSVFQIATGEKLSIHLPPPTPHPGQPEMEVCGSFCWPFFSTGFYGMEGRVLAGVHFGWPQEMTLLSGFDRQGPYISVACENGQKSG